MIFGALERMVAFRYLRPRKQERLISVIAVFSFVGIMLGVAALIVTLSVMNGFTSDLLRRILGLGGQITLEAPQGKVEDFAALAQKIAGIDGVVAVRPVIDGEVLASAGGRATSAVVRGMSESDLRSGEVGQHIVAGDLVDLSGPAVLVGSRLAAGLGVRPGGRISLATPNLSAGKLALPRARSFAVAALFSVDMPEYDSSFIFMPLATAQSYFGLGDAVTGLDVFVHDPYAVAAYEPEIAAAAGGKLRVSDWQQRNQALFGALKVERAVMFVILSLIILVAAFNIVCSMIMLVKDKGQDIAILRTMGASRGTILRVFVLSGASIGVAGTLAGFALGVLCASHIKDIQRAIEDVFGRNELSTGIAFFSQVPARIDWFEVALILAISFGLSFLATIYPSWRAARLDPVEALRYE